MKKRNKPLFIFLFSVILLPSIPYVFNIENSCFRLSIFLIAGIGLLFSVYLNEISKKP